MDKDTQRIEEIKSLLALEDVPTLAAALPRMKKRIGYSTAYQSIRRNGYRVRTKTWLEPIHPDKEAVA